MTDIRWNRLTRIRPTHAVDVTDFFERGMASLREHAAYLAALNMGDHAPPFRKMAQLVGARLGCELALAFDVVYGPGMPRSALMKDLDRAVAAHLP